ncbi:MAG TPA: SEC-C metal-binding domain-containing protein [Patescibacteria group bacterium]|jgi:hypothetical protein|nr:SEC-C metal-binding domain-containing protein [Patescibacteria group bacterium]
MRIQQSPKELNDHLHQQLEFLNASAEAYDKGFVDEAKRLAHILRLLLHDTSSSHSLLGQLNLKTNNFFSTSVSTRSLGQNQSRIGSYSGLIGLSVSSKSGYVPYLDDIPGDYTGYIDFDTYWNEIIFVDKGGDKYNRKEIILSVANQDGGSHVDPALDAKYAKLSRDNSLGWIAGNNEDGFIPVSGAELAAIRQIAHEVQRTLNPNMPKKKFPATDGFVLGGQGIILSYDDTAATRNVNKIGRNEACPCESGKKWKRCGLINSSEHQNNLAK